MNTIHVPPQGRNGRPPRGPFPAPRPAPAPAVVPAPPPVPPRRSQRIANQGQPTPAPQARRPRPAPQLRLAGLLREALMHIFDQGPYQDLTMPPDLPDGQPGVQRHYWLHHNVNEVTRRRRAMAEAAGAALPVLAPGWPNVVWHRRDFLGAGAFGIAYSYVAMDHNRNVVKRVVAKDCMMQAKSSGQISHWSGQITDPNKRVPIELASLRKLYDPAGNEYNTCQLIYAKHDVEAQQSTIIMQEGNFGDLHSCNDQHTRTPYAEPIIWAIAYNLLMGAHQLTFGRSSVLGKRKRGWDKEIVHRDLKPANIVISERAGTDQGPFQQYPHFAIADFGCAVHTSLSDPLNPMGYMAEEGTPGHQAPEQLAWIDAQTLRPWYVGQLSEKTNVWGIGLILMNCIEPAGLATNGFVDGPGDIGITNLRIMRNYSPQLIRFTNWLLRGAPNRRPTILKALRKIRRRCDPGWQSDDESDDDGPSDDDESEPGSDVDTQGDLAQGMWSMQDPLPRDDPRRLALTDDAFATWLARNRNPPQIPIYHPPIPRRHESVDSDRPASMSSSQYSPPEP